MSRLDDITMNIQYDKDQWLAICSLWAKCSDSFEWTECSPKAVLNGLKTKSGFYTFK